MIVSAPDNLAECDDQQLRDIERKADALRIRVIIELERRASLGVKDDYERRMAKRPQWARTASKLMPGPKGRIAAAVVFMIAVSFPNLVGPLHTLFQQIISDQQTYFGPHRGN